jgi:tetratricopeptide (TPR) repeat protein
MCRKFIVFILLFLPAGLLAQKNMVDSLYQKLDKEKADTNKVKLMCDIGYELRVNDPEKALVISNEALLLAKKIKYINGQSKSLGTIAIIFRLIGNFPLALEYNLKRLKLVEQTNNQQNYAGALINIGFVYVNQEEYKKALEYYYKADSVLKELDSVDDVKYKIALKRMILPSVILLNRSVLPGK